MPDLSEIGKLLIVLGVGLVVVGSLVMLLGKPSGGVSVFGWLGRLPGDFLIKRDHATFYFPLATSILISLVLSAVLYLVSVFFRR